MCLSNSATARSTTASATGTTAGTAAAATAAASAAAAAAWTTTGSAAAAASTAAPTAAGTPSAAWRHRLERTATRGNLHINRADGVCYTVTGVPRTVSIIVVKVLFPNIIRMMWTIVALIMIVIVTWAASVVSVFVVIKPEKITIAWRDHRVAHGSEKPDVVPNWLDVTGFVGNSRRIKTRLTQHKEYTWAQSQGYVFCNVSCFRFQNNGFLLKTNANIAELK